MLYVKFQQLLESLYNDPLEISRYIPDSFAKYGMLEAIPHLGTCLKDTRNPIILRIECAESLGKLGSEDGLEFLSSMLEDPNEELRRTIAWSIGKIGGKYALPYLQYMVRDRSELVIRWAAKGLQGYSQSQMNDTLTYLFSTFHLYHDDNIRVEILRLAKLNLKYSEVIFWINLAFKLRQNDNLNVSMASLELLATKEGISFLENRIDDLKTEFELLSVNSPLNPHYAHLLYKLNCSDFLKSILSWQEMDKAKSILLELHNEVDFLLSQLGGGENRDLIVLQALGKNKTLTFNLINIEKYLTHNNFDIQLAALRLHVLMGGSFRLIELYYKKKKALGTILSLMGGYKEALPILMKEAQYGDKTSRQSAIETLLLHFKDDSSAFEILKKIALYDRVWHIRRTIRNSLQLNNQN